jgi:hypothetical protein
VLRVTLRDTAPPIWRRVRVPGRYTLHQLHRVFQLLFGWQDYHLYEFEVAGRRFSTPDDDRWDEIPSEDATRATLHDLTLQAGAEFLYTYDFGDSWEHEIVVERLVSAAGAPDEALPMLLGGARAGPPEDAGGPSGYARLVEALRDPDDPEHQEYRTWAGEDYEPGRFDPWLANRMLMLAAAWGAL